MLRFCDSFDHYANADVLSKWDGAAAFSLGGGRFGNCFLAQSNVGGSTRSVTKTLSPASATWIVGFALRVTPAGGNNGNAFFLTLDSGTVQLDLRWNSLNQLVVTRAGTTLATTSAFPVQVWHYVEFKFTINNSTGSYELRVNGDTAASASGIDTQNTANASVNGYRWTALSNDGNTTPTFQIDDVYMCDNTGGTNNDFLGDVRIQALFPDGNGNSSQHVGSDSNSTDNYLLVDETAQDGDTTYVASSTVGEKDTYTYGDLTSSTGTVYGVQILPYSRKTDAGARSIVSVARSGATEEDSANKALSTSYIYLPDIRETKPGGGAWTISDVNAAEFGVKVTV